MPPIREAAARKLAADLLKAVQPNHDDMLVALIATIIQASVSDDEIRAELSASLDQPSHLSPRHRD